MLIEMWNNILETMDNKEERVGVMTVIDFSPNTNSLRQAGSKPVQIHRAFLVARVTL